MMKFLKVTVASAAILAAFSTAASATTMLDDPLHGFCSYALPSCADNGSITPVDNSSPNFGFTKSPDSGGPGDFFLMVLIPDNVPGANSEVININGVHTANATGAETNDGEWNGGFLDAFLGISASPQNPIGAFLPLTQQEDAGALGYKAYKLDFSNVTFGPGTDPTFSESFVFPKGTIITAFFDDPKKGWVATANSSAFIETHGGPIHNPGLPEPGTLALAGGALIGMGFIRRKRRNNSAAA